MDDATLFQGYFTGTLDMVSLMSGYLGNHPGATLVVFMIAFEKAQEEFGE